MIKDESEGEIKMFVKSVCCVVVLAGLLWGGIASAQDDFNAWKRSFRQEALRQGVSSTTLNKFLPRMTLLPQVVAADKKQPEFVSTFWEYVDARLTDKRIQEGQMLLRRYPTWLKKIGDSYEVPPEFILAFWGLETNYGKITGNTDVLKALTTLAYNPRRRKFFTRELIAFLKILEKERWDSVKGSWAGAFGQFQFMPTTFEAYAVDADHNGTRNILVSMPDAFASAANYLHKMGWDPAVSWGREVFLPPALDWNRVYDNQAKTVEEWSKMGIIPANGKRWTSLEWQQPASLLMPMGKEGPAFLTFPNFRRVMRWNKSELYALTVCFLADIIADRWTGIYAPRAYRRLSTDEVYQIQQRLAELGLYEDEPDGLVGVKTRRAILAFQRQKGVDEDGYPSEKLLDLLNIYRKELNQ
ncbi:MAG: lytic murein transglycosylase [Alphaproteobacteria bacterium]|nr:lytic murein transglycosylase [Alphaproteobacteria bacterium]